jgi:alpha-N-arabinofuranosidase
MPADNIHGWRADVVNLLKELNSPIYRWPGGNFVSGYNWKDGIGPRDKRAPRKNPAWTSVESNDVGIHEFMDLMQMIGSEPFIALNMGLGSVEDAAAEVEYVVGPATSPMGKLRAGNGQAEPFPARYWAVGNEMYGRWQLGFMPQDQYIKKHNDTAAAIWKIDPKAQLVAVGNIGEWTQNMFKGSASSMNLLSEHIYCKELPDPIAHAKQLADEIKKRADAHRQYRKEIPQLQGKDIRIAMDEWNYWYGRYVFGELGVRYRLKDALGVALGLHEYFRNSDLFFMANYAQTINVLGAIKTTPTAASLETTGEALKMYRAHFGTIPVPIDQQPEGLDVSIAWTADRSTLTVSVINLTNKPDTLTLNPTGGALRESAGLWEISGSDMEAYNDPGKPPSIAIKETNRKVSDNTLRIPAQSAVIYSFEKR